MSKRQIREIEEELPPIGVSIAKLPLSERLSVDVIYRHANRMLQKTATGSHMLEVGCGDGLLLNEIYNKIGSHFSRYIGIDFSINKLKCARDRSKRLGTSENTDFVLADAENLPFKDETFDAAVMLEVLEHFSEPLVIVNSLGKCLKITGKVVFTTPSAYGLHAHKLSLRTIFLPKTGPTSRANYIIVNGKRLPHKDFTLLEIQKLLSQKFVLKKFYCFNFGTQTVTKHLLPNALVAPFTIMVEDKASLFPFTLGHNWAILCEKIGP